MQGRTYDVVVYGATGFTGGLVAEYLAERASAENVRWALAGRSADKLEAVRDRLPEPARAQVETLVADAGDEASLRRMAAQTRVVLTTVGPYARYGEPLVAACIDEGTDYVDLTGEPEFVARLIDRYDDRARQRGLRIVPCCGFDSVPHDLGALVAVLALGADEPIQLEGFVLGVGTFSGGTWHSAIEAMGKAGATRKAVKALTRAGRSLMTTGRKVGGGRHGIRFAREVGTWVAPLPTIDPQIVLYSARLLDAYGPAFRYGHFVRVRSLPKLVTGVLGVGSLFALAQLPPTRKLLLRVRKPGEGPSAQQRARSRFSVVLVGRAGERRVRAEVSGGDPGYGETSKMIAESALCLARDRDRLGWCGVVTPAAAMGMALVDRLRAAGLTIEATVS